MGFRKQVKALLTQTRTDGYGPLKANPVYSVKHPKTGEVFEVSRHEWTIPTRSWGWRAILRGPDGKIVPKASVYGDNMDDLLHKMGYSWEQIGG